MRPWLSVSGTRCTRCVPPSHLKIAVGAVALHRERDLLVAAAVARARAELLDLEAAPLGVAREHPVDVARPERRLVAADALAHLEDDVLAVGGVARAPSRAAAPPRAAPSAPRAPARARAGRRRRARRRGRRAPPSTPARACTGPRAPSAAARRPPPRGGRCRRRDRTCAPASPCRSARARRRGCRRWRPSRKGKPASRYRDTPMSPVRVGCEPLAETGSRALNPRGAPRSEVDATSPACVRRRARSQRRDVHRLLGSYLGDRSSGSREGRLGPRHRLRVDRSRQRRLPAPVALVSQRSRSGRAGAARHRPRTTRPAAWNGTSGSTVALSLSFWAPDASPNDRAALLHVTSSAAPAGLGTTSRRGALGPVE